jgi:hypothetical protein
MLAIGRKPSEAYVATSYGFDGIYLPYVLDIMLGERMVSAMHHYSRFVVIYCYVYGVSGCQVYSGGSAAATRKAIYYTII